MKQHQEDLGLLMYAGMMGHEFVGVSGEPTKRRVACECNSASSAQNMMKDAVNPLVWQQYGTRKWRLAATSV